MTDMADSRIYVVQHRRRREGRTDYRLRLKLIKSGKPRLVVRKSSNNIMCQVIEYGHTGDKVVASADSRKLKEFGWTGHCGNIPAAYLTGMLCGVNAKKAGVKDAILDAGLYTSTRGSRIYAALKGAVDGGISVPHSAEILPAADRIAGKHTKDGGKAAKEFEEARKKIGK